MSNSFGIYDTESYSYDLPPELIAQKPAQSRDSSRMMLLDRATGEVSHHVFSDISDILPDNSMLVLNNTRVIPVRLHIRRSTGGRGEILLVKQVGDGLWEVLSKPARKIRPGDIFEPIPELTITVIENKDKGRKIVRLQTHGLSLDDALAQAGDVPLPPYIQRNRPDPADRERYQTVYASENGSAAAPTAGLHFTPEVLTSIAERGIPVHEVTLHVGPGTFLPVRTEDIREHNMHSEFFSVSSEVLSQLRTTQRDVCAVGTTTVRTLETVARIREDEECIDDLSGETDIFIYPGFEFNMVDMLLTNFHLPHSSLLMLVSAFAGKDVILEAYRKAVENRYRFYSYGDCMLIV